MLLRRRRKVVVITGASAGLGRAVAREYARRGARIGLLARGIDALKATRAEVEKLGGQALTIPTDVADAEAVEAAAEQVERAFGPIDVWINNAMASVFSPVQEMQSDEYRRVSEVTYLGTVFGTQAALRRMAPRGRGTIVQVGSALAYRAIPLQSAYCAAKHAVNGFTESLRCELIQERSNVRLTMVQLPALNTPQFHWCRTRLPGHPQPVPPIYQPEVAAEAAAYEAPFPDNASKAGVRRFPALVPDGPDAPGAAISRRARDWWQKSWKGESFMAVGAKDPVLGPPVMQALRKIIRNCPEPYLHAEGGHFLQEWGGDIAAEALASCR